MKTAETFYNQLKFNLSYIIEKPSISFLLFIGVFIVSMVPMVFIPLYTSLGMDLTIVNVIVVNIVYASLSFNWKKSTAYKNFKLTRGSKVSFNASVWIITTLMSLIFFVVFFILVTFYNQVGILPGGWVSSADPGVWNFQNLRWAQLVYFFILNSTVIFAISFGLSKLFNNENAYYIFTFTLIILVIMFGAGLNDFFDFYHADANGKAYVAFDHSLFPESMFIPSLFMPFYASSQLMASLAESIRPEPEVLAIQFSAFRLLPLTGNFVSDSSWVNTAVAWDFVWFESYIWIIVLGTLGVFMGKSN